MADKASSLRRGHPSILQGAFYLGFFITKSSSSCKYRYLLSAIGKIGIT
ncbi:MAG: hypothetical protein PHD88_08460 [Firmicutes bacterium]|nr:hypothetical protein [Bacillota bacterium]MDD4694408.1 hypothetical protein [Bacillota bacterium]